jgi:hypothetical protein
VGPDPRTLDERRDLILNAIRLGALSNEDSQQTLRLALALVEKYAAGGKGTAAAMETALKNELELIPAEIVADQAVKLLKGNQLFLVGLELEMAAYHSNLPPFDNLSVQAKSMVGALLDYAGLDRQRFAQSWEAVPATVATTGISEAAVKDEPPQSTLFSEKP